MHVHTKFYLFFTGFYEKTKQILSEKATMACSRQQMAFFLMKKANYWVRLSVPQIEYDLTLLRLPTFLHALSFLNIQYLRKLIFTTNSFRESSNGRKLSNVKFPIFVYNNHLNKILILRYFTCLFHLLATTIERQEKKENLQMRLCFAKKILFSTDLRLFKAIRSCE